ncbi:MAG: DMT family transporter [Ruminococcaceae bacterium]|nr:DMT family transporter [Oscillospiraceae bacterium]
MKQKTQFKGVFMLCLTAIIWGSAFVAQSVGMESVQSFTFGGIRTLLGALVLIPFILVRDSFAPKESAEIKRATNIKTLKYGIILGLIFCLATNFQQFAFTFPDASPGKIAFITAVYMFLVPLLGLIFLRKKVSVITWVCVALGFIGLYLLCVMPGDISSVSMGDILTFICSIFFAVHILAVEKFAKEVDGVKLSFVQFFVSGVITTVLMFVFEDPQISAIKSAALPILYSGVMSCGIAYTFQIIGQKYTEATVASIIMCTESVFAVLCSALILADIPTARELIGCVIMFIAIIVSECSEIITEKIKSLRAK